MKAWKKSSWKEADGSAGEMTLSAGKFYGDEKINQGIKTGPDSKYFAYYSEMSKAVDTTGKDLVVQFSVKHEQDIDCGGGYIKLLPASRCAELIATCCRPRAAPHSRRPTPAACAPR